MTPPRLSIRLAEPWELLAGRINTRITPMTLDIAIDRTAGVAGEVLAPLQAAATRVLRDIATVEVSKLITVRYFLERDIPDLVHIDWGAAQVDVYLERGSMPPDVADELAGHSTYLTRKLLLPKET